LARLDGPWFEVANHFRKYIDGELPVSAIQENCSVCGASFEVTFRYQMEERDGGFAFYCSQQCLQRSHGQGDADDSPQVTCDACAKRFALTLASQVLYAAGRRRYACSMECRRQLVREAAGARLEQFTTAPAAPSPQPPEEQEQERASRPSSESGRRSSNGASSYANGWTRLERESSAEAARPVAGAAPSRPSSPAKKPTVERKAQRPTAVAVPVVPTPGRPKEAPPAPERTGWAPRRIAVFNQKGGTGKTTTSVNLAVGLADRGKRVLLLDTDSQGNVAVSLGTGGERSLYHVLVMGLRVADVTHSVRPGLDVLPSNETLAAAELYLAGRQQRDRVLAQRLESSADEYDYVIIDCSPSLSLMNQNALVFADSVLVPVCCDYLSLVGVRQVIKTVRNVNRLLHHPLQIWGVLPTFYDVRAKICAEALETLRSHFGERCLPPVRATTRLKEAPARAQSIFEYAPTSHGAGDYTTVVESVLAGHPAVASSRAAADTAASTRSNAPVPTGALSHAMDVAV
jgi:chromosome partitioning protein